MSAKKIANRLKKALLYDGKMEYALYEHELMAVLDQLKSSMKQNKDDHILM